LDEGLIKITLEDASAGEILCATKLTGKFHGVIPRISPSGKRLTIPVLFSEPLRRLRSNTSPCILEAS